MSYARRALLTAALLFCSSVEASGNDLNHAIAQANWNNAMYYYQNTPLSQSIPVLKGLSENNVVMAQWFLADALAKTGKPEEASKWLYTASLGTRMDSKICRQRDADSVEYRFVHAFSRQFSPLRANDEYRRQGLTHALAFHKPRLGRSAQPDWVCRMVANESTKRTRTLTTPDRRWEDTRTTVFEDYQKQSGLGQTRSPDLIRIHPVH